MTDLKTRNREALKELKAARGPETVAVQARLKEQVKVVNEITRRLKEGPLTVPEIAGAAGLPTSVVFFHLMALRKYGKVSEGPLDDGYFKYQLVSQAGK